MKNERAAERAKFMISSPCLASEPPGEAVKIYPVEICLNQFVRAKSIEQENPLEFEPTFRPTSDGNFLLVK
jgi:hypothetical protein